MSEYFTLNKKTIVFSYVAQFFQYGIGIIVLPFILKSLQASDVAIWYIFIAISSLAGLIDFGFSQSLSKHVSYVYSGAKILKVDGCDYSDDNSINLKLLRSLIFTCRRLYLTIASTIFLILLTAGTAYLYYTLKKDSSDANITDVIIPWALYSFTVALNLYYNYVLIFITGQGRISDYNALVIISKLTYVVSLVTLIYIGCGLMALVISNLLSAMVLRLMANHIYLDSNTKRQLVNIEAVPENLFSIIWPNAKKFGITNLGVLLFSQSGVFLSGLFLPLEEVAELGITLQLFGILTTLARVYLSSVCPKISSLWVKEDYNQIVNYFIKAQLLCYSIYLTGVFIIVGFGNFILQNIIHSNVLLPSTSVLLLYSFFYLMEMTHGNCVTLISTENKAPYFKAGLIAGCLSIVVTIVLLLNGSGILSFPIGLICGSLPYNSWKWPMYVFKRLKRYE